MGIIQKLGEVWRLKEKKKVGESRYRYIVSYYKRKKGIARNAATPQYCYGLIDIYAIVNSVASERSTREERK